MTEFLIEGGAFNDVITGNSLEIRITVGLKYMQTACNLSSIERMALRAHGWVSLRSHAKNSEDFKLDLLGLGQSLGSPVPTRASNLVDELMPQDKKKANSSSLSRMTGTGQQPWHIDLAHRLEPARYLVLGMFECQPITASTALLDASELIPEHYKLQAFTEPFLVRTGANSFYATIATRNQPFIRFDPGCMHGATSLAKQLMQKISDLDIPATYTHIWKPCSVLVIDNWKSLHRRDDASCSLSRVLYRVSVMGETE